MIFEKFNLRFSKIKIKNGSDPGLQILRSFKLLSKQDSPPHINEVFDSILVIESKLAPKIHIW